MKRAHMASAMPPLTLATLTALLVAPGLWLGASLDAAAFVLVGARMRQGDMPYRDVWDHKPPGVYVVEWLGQTILPWLDPWLVAWALSAACSVAAVLILYALMRRRFATSAAWGWSAVAAVGVACYPVALGGGLTETFALPLLLAAWWMVVSGDAGGRAGAAVGAFLALAGLMSLQAVAPAVALAAAAAFRHGDPGGTLRRATAVVVGAAVPAGLALAWLAAGGALQDTVDQLVTYNVAYRAAAGSPAELWLIVGLMLMGLLIPAAGGAVRVLAGRPGIGTLEATSLVWAIAGAVYVGYQGRIYLHYLILFVPALVVLAAVGFEGAASGLRIGGRAARYRAASVMGIVAVGLAVSGLVTLQVGGLVAGRAGDERAVEEDAAAWIADGTCASAGLFVWGNDPGLYLDSERAPYDRYIYLFPMVTEGYWSADRTAATLARWQADPPPVIVEGPAAVPLFRPAAGDRDSRAFDSLDSLREFVASHYRLAATFGDGDFYRDVYVYEPSGC